MYNMEQLTNRRTKMNNARQKREKWTMFKSDIKSRN